MIKIIVFLAIMIAGCWQFGSGSYIYTKAYLAQYFLNSAWSKTLQGQIKVKPWSWADTYPVAKIIFNNTQEEYIVLAGASGRTLAFGPGHISRTPLPGNGGNSVMAGHRNTHFTILKDVKHGDEITVQTPSNKIHYRIINIVILDQSQTEIMQDYGLDLLTLITCYPFDTLQTGGPLRYAVQAVRI